MQNSKPNLILLPALMCDHTLYNHQIQTLKDRFNIKVFTISDIVKIEDATQFIIEEMQGEKFSLVGSSMGGYIAMDIMKRYPKYVERLCLINTFGGIDSEEIASRRRKLIEEATKTEATDFSSFNEKTIGMYLYNLNAKDISLLKEGSTKIGRDGFIKQQMLILSRGSSLENFKYYKTPTLIIGGNEDKITPIGMQEDIQNNIPASKLVILDQCGHLASLDQKIAVSALLDYWLQ